MSDEELPTFEEEELEETTLEAIRDEMPRIFAEATKEKPNVSFEFELYDIATVKVKRNMKTQLGTADMYILKSNPIIYCFRNAFNHLAEFVETNKIKLPATIKYIGREGSTLKTVYLFEKA